MEEILKYVEMGATVPFLIWITLRLRFVEKQVSNHLPTSIKELGERLNGLPCTKPRCPSPDEQ